ncbi:MAG TPA: hypothetical protein VM290_03530 [Gaiellaceae bacterium]|nr:hypothetical protein [Gaiellaceae bacterium]
MPRPFRIGPLGLALTAVDVWRRLPPKQRQAVLRATRTHGPKLAARAVKAARAARSKRPTP